jgi:acyl dehydratase
MHLGQTAIEKRTFSQDDFNRFAALSGDDNPIHVDPDFAAHTRFGKTVAHGMLLYGAICGALSAHFPGAVQVEQELMFPTPTFAGEEITVRLEVLDVQPGARRARIDTLITRSNGEVACRGQTVVAWSQA